MEEKKGYRAVGKYLMVSPKKVRPIADLIRRKPYTEAVAQLDAIPNGGAAMLKKVLQSAAANATNNFEMDPDKLYVAEIYVNQGPTMKRWRAGSQGRAGRILKRSAHIGVTVKER